MANCQTKSTYLLNRHLSNKMLKLYVVGTVYILTCQRCLSLTSWPHEWWKNSLMIMLLCGSVDLMMGRISWSMIVVVEEEDFFCHSKKAEGEWTKIHSVRRTSYTTVFKAEKAIKAVKDFGKLRRWLNESPSKDGDWSSCPLYPWNCWLGMHGACV